MKTEVRIKCHTEKDRRYHINTLKEYGYKKTHDCMWTVIFEKGESTVIIEIDY